MSRANEFNPGTADSIRRSRDMETPEFKALRAAVLAAAVEAYKSTPARLREAGGITAIMKRAAAGSGTFPGIYGVPTPLEDLLDYSRIRLEAFVATSKRRSV